MIRLAIIAALSVFTGCVTIDRALLRTVPAPVGETNVILEPRPEILTGIKVAGAVAPYPWAGTAAGGLALLLSGYAAMRTRKLNKKPDA